MRKILLSTLCIVGITIFSVAQKKNKTAIKYANTITKKDLSKHLHIIAADSMEGRYTGKEGQRKAARYIAAHFKNIGLKPTSKGKDGTMSYLQHFKMINQKWINASISVGGQKFEFIKDIYGIGQSNMLKRDLTLNTVYYNSVEEALKGKNVNKAVFLDFFGNRTDRSNLAAKLAQKTGATAVCYVAKEFEKKAKYDKYNYKNWRRYLAGGKDQRKLAFYVSENITNAIFSGKKGTGKTIKLSYQLQEQVEFESSNVAGLLEGENKNEYLIITAHYDHVGMDKDGNVYNGADDDGSGTVTVLELAEAFMKAAKAGNKPKRNIVFMTVSGEELGLYGSRFYTDISPIFPLEQTVANLNIDMIGRIGGEYIAKKDPNFVYLIGSDKLSTELHELSENAQKTYQPTLKLDYKYNDENDPNRFYYRSDHYNFAKNNIPIIFYFNGVHKDYHKTTDTVEKIHFGKMEKIGRLVFHTAWEIANRKNRLKVDKAGK